MYLNNFVEIIYGTLRNKPSIAILNDISARANAIKKGDIFIAREISDIQTAINNGAYAIVSDECVEISDSEIAWILVNNLSDCLFRFMKYAQLMNNIEIFMCPSDTLLLARHVLKGQVGFGSDVFEMLEYANEKIILIDFEILHFPVLRLERALCEEFIIINKTLFESSIEFRHKIHNISLPSIFLENLNDILNFCAHRHLEPHFVDAHELLPIFIDSQGFGVDISMRCVYATKNKYIAQRYCELFKRASWGKFMFLELDSKDEILRELRNESVHFFVIFGIDMNALREYLTHTTIERSLF